MRSFFFSSRRRHTRSLCDWSSDVCSSDLFLAVDRRIDPAFLGYPLQAYVLVNLKQRLLSRVAGALREVPEVLEVHGLSGAADLLVQVVARDGDDLYRVAGRILDIKGVKRTKTSLVMRHLVDF